MEIKIKTFQGIYRDQLYVKKLFLPIDLAFRKCQRQPF